MPILASSPRPTTSRTRSSTIIGIGPAPAGSAQPGPPAKDVSATSLRVVTEPSVSAAAAALSTLHENARRAPGAGHTRVSSWPTPPIPSKTVPSAPAVPTRSYSSTGADGLFPVDRVQLTLYTYKASTGSSINTQPSPLPSTSTPTVAVPSVVFFSYAALPWTPFPGDYLEIRRIRRIRRPDVRAVARTRGMGGEAPQVRMGGEALRGVMKNAGRDGYVFKVGENATNVPVSQIQVPESVAAAFKLQHRTDMEVVRIAASSSAYIDYIELHFSQYLGRADMWRLGMSLENSTVHTGEKITLAGGAVRAEVHGIWRGSHRFSSGIVTAKTKTIYRSKSAQVYIFIQLCQETWEFDEDGQRYYEKIVHGFLPELFTRWAKMGTSHLVTIILFARVHYDDEEVAYMRKQDLTLGLTKDYQGRWCKDFFRVAVDFERRSDWNQSLGEIKQRLERSEREILLDFHLAQLREQGREAEEKRIVGRWSFAYEGNVLETISLALNPFEEHYIDRDLSRTGLSITIITPGTGHFAVDKNLLRLTTERMIDNGIALDFVCLTKMPLHSVPLFSYVSQRPSNSLINKDPGAKTMPATPDLLYFDAHSSGVKDCEDADSIPKWVNSSYYSRTHDKPFRKDRFIPRCKMYEIQMLGILDHNLTTVTVPMLDGEDRAIRDSMSTEDRKVVHDDFDATIFGGKSDSLTIADTASVEGMENSLSVPASYASARLLAHKLEDRRALSPSSSIDIPGQNAGLSSGLGVAGVKLSPDTGVVDSPAFERLNIQRTSLRSVSPVPSALSLGRSAREISPSRSSEISVDASSGNSTPSETPVRRLKIQGSKGSLASRFGTRWLFSALGQRSQPSFPAAAAETVGRHDVISTASGLPGSPAQSNGRTSQSLPLSGALVITPSSPSPAKQTKDTNITQPVPIASRATRMMSHEDLSKSHRGSVRLSGSPVASSWGKVNTFNRDKTHVSLNPCNPKENIDTSFGEGRRWQHVRPKATNDSQHLVKWASLCAPACLPLTTDFMPTPSEIQDFYEFHPYSIACYPNQVSFLVRPDAAQVNLPLAVMREMASQRLSQNFQFIVLPHDQDTPDDEEIKAQKTRKVLLPGDATHDGLRAGGASEVLGDAHGAIYLLWSNHIHRIMFDSTKMSVNIQRFVRKMRYGRDPVSYRCLVWPSQMKGFQEASAKFEYPNVDAKLNFNYLDRLIAGEEHELTSSVRCWRTRYILIPSGRDPMTVQGIVPKGEKFNSSDILIAGAYRVLEVLGRSQRTRPGEISRELQLLATTFDPSACVLDHGLMTELERVISGKETIDGGNALEGMTLQKVGEMMCQPNNRLVIRDRWWNFTVYEECFTGEQFCAWLLHTFTDVKNAEEAAEWGRSLFGKGLFEHVTGQHGFIHYGYFFYRLRPSYDVNANKQKKATKSWFGGKPAQDPRDLIERHAAMSTSPNATVPLGKLRDSTSKPSKPSEGPGKRRKIQMSQSVILDLDPGRKSDRAEVAILHADIIHNDRNAFHFELNWLGVTAALLDDLRARCAAQAERYGLRFVEAPVEQIKDVSLKCAYRTAMPIPLAVAPPVVPDLHLRLTEHGTGHSANFFEYAILTEKFGFVLDVEADSRYPETIEVEYSYRGKATFEYSQFCHRSGVALVQCIGGTDGFLWSDNRLFIAAPARGRGGASSSEAYPNAPLPLRMTKQEEARALRTELEAFCADSEALRKFYEEVLPPLPEEKKVQDIESQEETIEKAD